MNGIVIEGVSMIQLYCVTLPESISEDEICQMYLGVSPERAARAKRFLKEEDRLRSLAGELLLRKVLRETHGITVPQLGVGPCGKPQLMSGEPFFNISHAGAHVLLAVGDVPLGVDVEQVRPVSVGVSDMVFTDDEQQWIWGASDSDAAFFQLWTLKESYIKALGLGMRKALRSFSFVIEGEDIRLFDTEDATAGARFFFRQGVYEGSWWALCSEGAAFVVGQPESLSFQNLL